MLQLKKLQPPLLSKQNDILNVDGVAYQKGNNFLNIIVAIHRKFVQYVAVIGHSCNWWHLA